jgi:hypothetical protein
MDKSYSFEHRYSVGYRSPPHDHDPLLELRRGRRAAGGRRVADLPAV